MGWFPPEDCWTAIRDCAGAKSGMVRFKGLGRMLNQDSCGHFPFLLRVLP